MVSANSECNRIRIAAAVVGTFRYATRCEMRFVVTVRTEIHFALGLFVLSGKTNASFMHSCLPLHIRNNSHSVLWLLQVTVAFTSGSFLYPCDLDLNQYILCSAISTPSPLNSTVERSKFRITTFSNISFCLFVSSHHLYDPDSMVWLVDNVRVGAFPTTCCLSVVQSIFL